MLLGEPQPSQYDWNLQVFGFPTRVTWLLWAGSAALGYNSASHVQFEDAAQGDNVPLAALLAVWVGVVFVSILVHELGHALAFRYFGIQCQIILYQMGGLAVPGAGMLWGSRGHWLYCHPFRNCLARFFLVDELPCVGGQQTAKPIRLCYRPLHGHGQYLVGLDQFASNLSS